MSAGADSRCPRCGGAFHCGVTDVEPCACTTLLLDDVTLTELRQGYTGCLCLACLREISATKQALASEP